MPVKESIKNTSMKTDTLSSEDKKTIDLLRFPLALLVLYIHADLMKTNSSSLISPDATPFLWNVDYLISKIIGSVSVPAFFLISGLLFFKYGGGISIENWKQKCKSRFRSLFVPYLIWNTIFLLVLAFAQHFYPTLMGHSKLIASFSIWDFVLCFISMDYVINGFSLRPFLIGPIDLPLWFIRDLMILVVLAPLIQFLIQRLGKFFIMILLGLWVLCVFKHVMFIGLNGICFFSIGAYFGIERIGFRYIKKYGKLAMLFYVITILIEMIYKMDSPEVLSNVNILLGVVVWIYLSSCLASRMKRNGSWLSKSSFFIYASHYYAVILFMRAAIKITPQNDAILTLVYLCVPISLGVVLAYLYKILPSSSRKILTGGR